MRGRDEFSGFHPLVNLLYFGLVIGFSMFFMHPVCLLISLVSAIAYYVKLHGGGSLKFLLKVCLPLLLITAVLNPAFNHQGSVILCYLPSGNPLTLESIVYGVAAAVLLVSVLLWFGCYSAVMSSDKFVYLFGRIAPALSLVLSMTLRFVPRFKRQLDQVKQAQAGIGRGMKDKNLFRRLRNALTCFSIMVTWALENAIETADSMKSRGYGLPGRTAFSIYTLTERDKTALLWLIFGGFCVFGCSLSGAFSWQYFPDLRGILIDPLTILAQAVYLLLCITPLIIDGRQERVWKSLRSAI